MLEIDDLHSAYGRIEVLKGVSLKVQAGEVVALIGSNGAGKTTLMRALSGVQPITAGSIKFLGEPIEKLSSHARVRRGVPSDQLWPWRAAVFGAACKLCSHQHELVLLVCAD